MDEYVERGKLAAESLLENESLTDGLDDPTASLLLRWGVDLAHSIAARTAGMDDTQAEEEMDGPMRGLRRMIRNISQWVQAVVDGDAEAAEESLNTAVEQSRLVYAENTRDPDERLLNDLIKPGPQAPADPTQLIARLRQALEATTTDQPPGSVGDREEPMFLLPPGETISLPGTTNHSTDQLSQDEHTTL